MSDVEIRDRLLRLEEAALAELYDRLAPRAFGLALSMIGDSGAAEEVVSDTFVQVWKTAESFDPGRGSLDAWVLAICRSRALDRIRTRRRRRELAEREEHEIARFTTSEGPPDPERVAMAGARMSGRVGSALEALPAEQRRAIELAHLGGLTQREIANELEIPLGTVKTRIRSGMQKLRDALVPGDGTGASSGGTGAFSGGTERGPDAVDRRGRP